MRLFSYALGIAAGAALLLSGCSKDSNPSNPVTPAPTQSPLVGRWTVISGVDTTVKYILFREDNSFTLQHQYAYGLRGVENGIYQTSGSTVQLGYSLYAFTLSKDTLTLSNPDETIVSARSAAGADSSWVKSAVILDNMPAPIAGTTDISIQGDTLWYGNQYSADHLFRIRISSRAVDTSLAVGVYAWAVEWDGTNVWCGNDGHGFISRINATTGATLFTSRSMGAWIYGIAWDGTSLWCASHNEQSLYRYNPSGNAITATIPLDTSPAGLAYAGGYLYVCVGGVINVCERTPFKAVAAYAIANADAFGIASDGTNFWVSCRTGGTYKILKVTLP